MRLGALDPAAQLLDGFETRSREVGRLWGVVTAAGCRGLLLAAHGDRQAAEAALAALELHPALPMPYEQARTLLIAGEVHRGARHKTLAHDVLLRALEIFERSAHHAGLRVPGLKWNALGCAGPLRCRN